MSPAEVEKTKLTATFMNNVAVAIIGGGLVAPFFAVLYGLSNLEPAQIRSFALTSPVWLLIGAGIHLIARASLGGIKQ